MKDSQRKAMFAKSKHEFHVEIFDPKTGEVDKSMGVSTLRHAEKLEESVMHRMGWENKLDVRIVRTDGKPLNTPTAFELKVQKEKAIHQERFSKIKVGDSVNAFHQRGFLIKKFGTDNNLAIIRFNAHSGDNGSDQYAFAEDVTPHPSGTKMRITENNINNFHRHRSA